MKGKHASPCWPQPIYLFQVDILVYTVHITAYYALLIMS